jgi:hypothetical protein
MVDVWWRHAWSSTRHICTFEHVAVQILWLPGICLDVAADHLTTWAASMMQHAIEARYITVRPSAFWLLFG